MRRTTMVLFLLLAGGCLGRSSAPTSPLFVELHNDTQEEANASITVFESYGDTAVYEHAYTLNRNERILVDPISLLHGSYRLRSVSGDLVRDADVRIGDDDYYRFVILEDIIAFQQVDR